MTDATREAAPVDVSARPMTTAGLQAKVWLRQAWFESHPDQPVPEARARVEELFAAIEAEAAALRHPAPGEPQGLRAALAKATDVGIYPAVSPAGPRTPWQDGWNAGVMAVSDAVDAALAAERPEALRRSSEAVTPRRFDALKRDEWERVRAETERYHGGRNEGVAHDHTRCRLVDEYDELLRAALPPQPAEAEERDV